MDVDTMLCGQMSSVYLFSEALLPQQVAALNLLGPGYKVSTLQSQLGLALILSGIYYIPNLKFWVIFVALFCCHWFAVRKYCRSSALVIYGSGYFLFSNTGFLERVMIYQMKYTRLKRHCHWFPRVLMWPTWFNVSAAQCALNGFLCCFVSW